MADAVQQIMEQMLPELEDLIDKGIFTTFFDWQNILQWYKSQNEYLDKIKTKIFLSIFDF